MRCRFKSEHRRNECAIVPHRQDRIRAHRQLKYALPDSSSGLVTTNVIPMVIAAHPDGEASFFEIFRRPFSRLTFLQTLVNFCSSWDCGALTSWVPFLLAKEGLDAPQGLSFIAQSALFMFPGYIAASYPPAILATRK